MTESPNLKKLLPIKGIRGEFMPPGDKSISHRAVMFGALSEGESRYSHFLEAADCLATVKAFEAMGVGIELTAGTGEIRIKGVGLRGLKPPQTVLDLGNSGTTTRLLLGILSGQRFEATLTGDDSLHSRPMQRVTKPLKKMGAQIKGRDEANFLPLVIHGGKISGIEYENKLGSAQVKSAILLAGLYGEEPTRILDPVASRDHTERFLKSAGATFRQEDHWLIVEKTEKLKNLQARIPGDISSAAFFIAGAAMTPGSKITIQEVSLNPTRTGILSVLKRMGARIKITPTQEEPEPVGTLEIEGARLEGTRIAGAEIPTLIDELPVLMVVMALAEGESLIAGAGELRVKETDRIHSMVENLNQLGAQLQELPDGCVIKGVSKLKGTKVSSFGDHRTVMSLAIATLAMEGELEIDDISSVATSFPGFFEVLDRLAVK